jgi:hypothetical protein
MLDKMLNRIFLFTTDSFWRGSPLRSIFQELGHVFWAPFFLLVTRLGPGAPNQERGIYQTIEDCCGEERDTVRSISRRYTTLVPADQLNRYLQP